MASPEVPVFQVNAFADGPDSGNPAGVVLLAGAPLLTAATDAARQHVAAQVGLSETAFVEPASSSAGDGDDVFATVSLFRLRWFTPTQEVPLCGHATLAAAAVIFAQRRNPSPEIKFETASGLLVVARAQAPAGSSSSGGDSSGDDRLFLRMSLPAVPPSSDALPPSLTTELVHGGPASIGGVAPSRGLTALLWPCLQSLQGVAVVPQAPHHQGPGQAPDWPSQFLASVVGHVGFAAPLKYLLVVLAPGISSAQLAALAPDTRAMADAVPAAELTGVIVATAAGAAAAAGSDQSAPDLALRFFGPWAGIPEDPVTGSAFSVTAPYASAALLGGKQQLACRQCSARGGDVWVDLAAEPGRVLVTGQALVLPGARALQLQ